MHRLKNSSSGTAPGGRSGTADASPSLVRIPAAPAHPATVPTVAMAFLRNSRRFEGFWDMV